MKYAAVLSMAALAGCAYTPMEAQITPTIQYAQDDIGLGQTVQLTVVDERARQDIGNRGGAGFSGARIKFTGDMAAIFQESITDMLQAKGFRVVYSGGQSANTLRVDIREIEYRTSTGFWTGGVHVNAAIKGTAANAQETYDRMYVSDAEERVVFVPGADGNNEMINTAIDGILKQLGEDRKLLDVLSLAPPAAPQQPQTAQQPVTSMVAPNP